MRLLDPRRSLRPAPLLAFLLTGPLAAAPDLLPLPGGDMGRATQGGDTPAGLECEGPVTWAAQDGPRGAAARLEARGVVRARTTWTDAPAADQHPAPGWFGLASIDVVGLAERRDVRLTLRVLDAEGRELATGQLRVESDEARFPRRLSVPFAPPTPVDGTEGAEGTEAATRSFTVEVRGDQGYALVDDLRVERFHRAPTRKLVGKANGKLGPDLLGCGALGLTGLTEHGHGAFSVLEVRAGGPADAAGLRPGDLVLGVDGRALDVCSLAPGHDWFERSHEARLGRALLAAVEGDRRRVKLTVLPSGASPGETAVADPTRLEPRELALDQPFRGPIDPGFPLRGRHAEQLRADLLRWTLEHQRENGSWPGTDAVNPALAGLALLGTRNPEHRPAIERAIAFLLEKNPRPSEMRGLAYWTIAFQGLLLAEYHLATGDERALEWVREAVEWIPTTSHTCKWDMPALGHGPDGIPYDEKSLMAPTAHLLVLDALARRCGLESRVYEHVEAYVQHSWSDPEAGGHGGMGYNASYRDQAEFWSRSGLTALASHLRGGKDRMREPLLLIMEERHPWMLNSHAYGEPGAALGLVALGVVAPERLARVLPQWRWRFLCSWEPGYGLRYSTPHMGAPYMGQESVVNLAYLLLTSVEHGGLVCTGGEAEAWLGPR